MILKYPEVKDYIFKYNLLPGDVCDSIVNRLEKRNKWEPHGWYDAVTKSEDTKADFLTVKDEKCRLKIFPYIRELCMQFHEKYYVKENTNSDIFWSVTSSIKFNKYSVGESIQPHHDHIHDMFDGKFKGIPTVSIIGALNEDYEGGQLTFWNDYVVELRKGDVVAFPSVFMFPHEVQPVTSGTRYSWVTWCV